MRTQERIMASIRIQTASENCELKARAYRKQAFRECDPEFFKLADRAETQAVKLQKEAEKALWEGEK